MFHNFECALVCINYLHSLIVFDTSSSDKLQGVFTQSLPLPSGVHAFLYVVRSGRVGQAEGRIARAITKYVFDGMEHSPNLCIVMTHCQPEQLRFSRGEKATWLYEESERNSHFKALYEVVGKDPRRVFLVDNQGPREDTFESRAETHLLNEKGIAPLREYILGIKKPLAWQEEEVLEKINRIKNERERLKEEEQRLKDLETETNQRKERAKKVKQLTKILADAMREYAEKTKEKAKKDGEGCFGGLCSVLVQGKGEIYTRDLKAGEPWRFRHFFFT